jgi:hypothetical protein
MLKLLERKDFDWRLTLSDGRVLRAHRTILAVRCPALLPLDDDANVESHAELRRDVIDVLQRDVFALVFDSLWQWIYAEVPPPLFHCARLSQVFYTHRSYYNPPTKSIYNFY